MLPPAAAAAAAAAAATDDDDDGVAAVVCVYNLGYLSWCAAASSTPVQTRHMYIR